MESKRKLLNSTSEYIDHNKKEKVQMYSTLTTSERKGLKRLRQREEVVFQTDKSGRYAADTKENYSIVSKPHVDNDETITEEVHEGCQKEINAHAIIWTRILRAGKHAGSLAESRIKGNMTVEAGSH